MLRAPFIILVCFLLFSCNANKRATKKFQKLINENKHLIERVEKRDTIVRVDTVMLAMDSTVIDTVVFRQDTTVFDTITVKNEKVETAVHVDKSGPIIKYKVRTVVKPDSIPYIVKDTIFINEADNYIPVEYKEKGVPWYAWLIVSALALVVLIQAIRK